MTLPHITPGYKYESSYNKISVSRRFIADVLNHFETSFDEHLPGYEYTKDNTTNNDSIDDNNSCNDSDDNAHTRVLVREGCGDVDRIGQLGRIKSLLLLLFNGTSLNMARHVGEFCVNRFGEISPHWQFLRLQLIFGTILTFIDNFIVKLEKFTLTLWSSLASFSHLWYFTSSGVGDRTLEQCDQIERFIALWATFQSLWQQLFCPNWPHFQAIFVKVSKSFIFSSEIIFGQLL